jgi:hypothetical protein
VSGIWSLGAERGIITLSKILLRALKRWKICGYKDEWLKGIGSAKALIQEGILADLYEANWLGQCNQQAE